MDCRVETVDGRERVEFSWEGQDELDPASGRGWAVIENGELRGRIFIHLGDDSEFRAKAVLTHTSGPMNARIRRGLMAKMTYKTSTSR